MFNPIFIQRCFRDWLGFNESYSDCETPLTERVTKSDSGFYFSQFHTLLQTDNLRSVAPNFNAYNVNGWSGYSVYDVGTNYSENELVLDSSETLLFQSLQNGNLGNDLPVAPENSDFWKFVKYKPTFENWLYQERDKAVLQAVRKVFDKKQLGKYTKKTFQDQYIYRS